VFYNPVVDATDTTPGSNAVKLSLEASGWFESH
jgi:hypothetical protein